MFPRFVLNLIRVVTVVEWLFTPKVPDFEVPDEYQGLTLSEKYYLRKHLNG